MIKISWQSRDITWLSRFDEKNCLSGFTVTSTRTLSKRENLDNCEPRGEGLASRLPARTRIIVVLWWASDTSLLSLRESLPLDSSLSLSRSTLSSRFTVSARFTRNFAQHALASRTITIYDYDSTIVITVCSRLPILLQAERRFFARRVLFLYSHFDIRITERFPVWQFVVQRFPGGDPEILL